MRYRWATTVPGRKRLWRCPSPEIELALGGTPARVWVGAELGVSTGAPQDGQKRLPSGTSPEQVGQRTMKQC
jgi:hypothetical protein